MTTKPTLRERLRALLVLGGDPHHLAQAFAVGVFIAFSPLFGLHVPLAVAAVALFRLNPVALFAGVLMNNFWTMVPLYGACLWVGLHIWAPGKTLPPLDFAGLSFSQFISQLGPYVMPFVVGSTLVGVVCSVLSYWGVRVLVRSYRRHRPPHPPEDLPEDLAKNLLEKSPEGE
ncbi:MAG: DUF2062 domain-containing protein [Nitrospirota bacterium]|nr:DUF2062 domain-containing protein [Nitrospirota bacterium]